MPQQAQSNDIPAGWEPVPAQDDASDYSHLTANTRINEKGQGEGTYAMASPENKILRIPYSNVGQARTLGFKIDPQDRETYANDLLADLKKQNPHANVQRSTIGLLLPDAYHTAIAAPEKFSKDWWKQKGYGAAGMATGLIPLAGGLIGGSIGGTAGAAAGGPVGGVLGGGTGAALGGAAGKGIELDLNNLIFNLPPKTPQQISKEIATEGAMQGLLEATGRAGIIPLKAAQKYFGKTALESAAAKIPLMPSEAHGKAPTWAENLLKGSIMTKGTMEEFRETQNAASQKAVDDLANRIATFHGTSEDLGKVVQDGIEAHTRAFRRMQDYLYAPIKKAMANQPVDQSKLQAFARQELARLSEVEKTVDPSLLSPQREMLENLIYMPKRPGAKGPRIPRSNITSFEGIMGARSSFLAAVRDQGVALADVRAGLAKKLAGLADEAMMDAANKSGQPAIAQALRDANQFTREEHERFDQKLVKAVIDKGNPEGIAALISKIGPSAPGLQETRDLFKVLPKRYHEPVQRQIILDMATKSMAPKTGVFREGIFAKNMLSLGDEKGQIIFGKNWQNVKKLSEVLGHIGGPSEFGGASGASLQNMNIIRNMVLTLGTAVPATLTATGNYGMAGRAVLGEVGGLAGQYALMRALAYTMTHPEATTKLLKLAEVLTKYGGRMGVAAGTDMVKAVHGERVRKEAEKKRAETMVVPYPKGLIVPGNIRIWDRPVVQNADGTHSSEFSVSYTDERPESPYHGREVLVPTVVNGRFLTPDGKKPPEGSAEEETMKKAALQHYYDTGEQLGIFDKPEDADAYANLLHSREGAAKPAAAKTYKFNYVNPTDGHKIGSDDGQVWYDKATGQQVK